MNRRDPDEQAADEAEAASSPPPTERTGDRSEATDPRSKPQPRKDKPPAAPEAEADPDHSAPEAGSDACPEELIEEPERKGPDAAEVGGLRYGPSLSSAVLVGLFLLAVVYTIYFTRALLLPIVLAILFNFLLGPMMRWLRRRHIPDIVSAMVVFLLFVGAVSYGLYSLSAPALDWIERAPQSMEEIQDKFDGSEGFMEPFSDLIERVEDLSGIKDDDPETMPVEVRGEGLGMMILGYSQAFAQGALVMFILLFFLLASGDLFLRKLVHVLPRMHDKKRAVEMTHEIEHSVSTYLLSVTGINIILGLATAGVLWLQGVDTPLLWGAMAAVFNYVPYLGPVVIMVILAMVGLLSFDSVGRGLMVPASFALLNLIEAYGLTPLLLGRQLSLNPVAVLLSLIFWGFIWGVPGALLAIPMLVTFKIFCDHIGPLQPISEFLSGDERRENNAKRA